MSQSIAAAEPPTRYGARFTTAEFHRIFDAALGKDIRLELVNGELARMTPPSGAHSSRQTALIASLWSIVGARVMVEATVALAEGTVLTCDAAVLHAPMNEQRFLRADEVLLAIEIAETGLDRDLGLKRGRYAAAGIATYWVVDGRRSVVHVHTDPRDGEYTDFHTIRFGSPLPVPGTDRTIVLD